MLLQDSLLANIATRLLFSIWSPGRESSSPTGLWAHLDAGIRRVANGDAALGARRPIGVAGPDRAASPISRRCAAPCDLVSWDIRGPPKSGVVGAPSNGQL